MAKKREMPNLVEEIFEDTRKVSEEAEMIDKINNHTHAHGQVHVPTQAQVYVHEYEQIKKTEIRSERLPIMMTPTMKRRLKKAADSKGISMSELIVSLTEKFLNDIEA